jgi:hypothetical protein
MTTSPRRHAFVASLIFPFHLRLLSLHSKCETLASGRWTDRNTSFSWRSGYGISVAAMPWTVRKARSKQAEPFRRLYSPTRDALDHLHRCSKTISKMLLAVPSILGLGTENTATPATLKVCRRSRTGPCVAGCGSAGSSLQQQFGA